MICVRSARARCSCPQPARPSAASSTRKSAWPIIWWKSYSRPRARSTHSSASLSLPTAATVSSSTCSGRRCAAGGATECSDRVAPSPADPRTLSVVPVDRATPRSGLAATLLDELLEALEIAFGPTPHEAQLVADRLHHALGFQVELQHDAGAIVGDPVEGDDAGVRRTAQRGPGDALVGPLLGDLGIPLPARAGDLCRPVPMGVVELSHRLHALHEPRALLELRPLVVGRPHGNLHLDRLLNGAHVTPLDGVV